MPKDEQPGIGVYFRCTCNRMYRKPEELVAHRINEHNLYPGLPQGTVLTPLTVKLTPISKTTVRKYNRDNESESSESEGEDGGPNSQSDEDSDCMIIDPPPPVKKSKREEVKVSDPVQPKASHSRNNVDDIIAGPSDNGQPKGTDKYVVQYEDISEDEVDTNTKDKLGGQTPADKTQGPQINKSSQVKSPAEKFYCLMPATVSRSPTTPIKVSSPSGEDIPPPLLSPQVENNAPRTLQNTQDSNGQKTGSGRKKTNVMPTLRPMVDVKTVTKKKYPKKERLRTCFSKRILKCRYCTRIFGVRENRKKHETTAHKQQLKLALPKKKIGKKVKRTVAKRYTCTIVRPDNSNRENSPPSSTEKIYICPVCHKPEDDVEREWIECETCSEWVHFECEGITEAPDQHQKWSCSICKNKATAEPQPGPSGMMHSHNTEKRKTSILREPKPRACAVCGQLGIPSSMIGCDACVAKFHLCCIGYKRFPPADRLWYCARCEKTGQSEQSQESKTETMKPNSITSTRHWSGPASASTSTLTEENKTENQKIQSPEKTNQNKSPRDLPPKKWQFTVRTRSVGYVTEMGEAAGIPENTVQYYECPLCSKLFISKRNRAEHIELHVKYNEPKDKIKIPVLNHDEENLRIYPVTSPTTCPICQMKCKTEIDQITHTATHLEENRLKCKHCLYSTGLSDDRGLARHVELRHPDLRKKSVKNQQQLHKRFKCDQCEKSFTSLCNLQDHQSIHSGTNLHKCFFCPQTFRWRSTVTPHVRAVHPEMEIKSMEDFERLHEQGYV